MKKQADKTQKPDIQELNETELDEVSAAGSKDLGDGSKNIVNKNQTDSNHQILFFDEADS